MISFQEDERLRTEKDDRKRKYNVTYSNDVSVALLIFGCISYSAGCAM